MEQRQQQEGAKQRWQGEDEEQQLHPHLGGHGESTGSPVPVPLSGCFRPSAFATPTASSYTEHACTLEDAARTLCSGTLLFLAASEAAAGATAIPEPPSCAQELHGEVHEVEGTRRSAAPTCRVPLRTGHALSFHTASRQRLLQRQQRLIGASSSALMRHVVLAEEDRAAFFSPERLPLILFLCSGAIPPVQKQQPRTAQNALRWRLPFIRGKCSNNFSAFIATIEGIEGAKMAGATEVATATGAEVPDSHFLLSFFWAVASWSSRLTDPLPVSAAAAVAELGLRSTTSARAAALAVADPSTAAAAAALAGGIPALQQRAVATASTGVAAANSLGEGICVRLAALRALAYWCCCCTLAEQEATHDVQKHRLRQQQRQQLALHAVPPRVNKSERRWESNRTSSSIALLRQLQQECRESFAQLLVQQQDAQQQLAERQGIEMEAACALREKQEQALKAAIAARCLPVEDSGDAKDPTAVAAAALSACEKDLQELVQQHLSECELLERHWKHEQQLLRKQKLHMFKNVAADLYLLQHGSAAMHGAACQELVLPPLPSADETERWAFDWKQQKQEQQRQEQLLQDQQQQPSWRQVGVAARQLFRRRVGSSSQEGDPMHDAPSYAACTSAAGGAAVAAKEERLRRSGAAAAYTGSSTAAAAAMSALMGATEAAGQANLQQQKPQRQQVPSIACKVDNSAQCGPAQLQREVQQQQQHHKQYVLQDSSTDLSEAHSQLYKQHKRQLAIAAAAHQGPVFDMPRLLQGIATGALQSQQRRISGVPQQQQLPRQLGGVQEHAEIRLIFGAQQRRTIWLHVCTGLTADFFPSSTYVSPEQQHEQQQGSATVLCAGKWLSLLGQGATAFPDEPLGDWPGGAASYCYTDVRHMRGACFVGSSGRPSSGEPLSWQEAGGLSDDMFAALKSGPGVSHSGAVLPTGAAMQESCACIEAGNDTPDLLLPSLEEQRRLLRVAVHAVRGNNNFLDSEQRLLLQQGEVFVSRHAARLRPQVCFHLAVASARLGYEPSQPSSPSLAAQFAEAPVEHESNKRRSSAGDDLDSLCEPVCDGLRQILRLCEKHAIGALLLPALLLETEASATCLPFALLQRRMLAVLRCVVAELRAVALSPVSNSCCSSDVAVGRLRHVVLLLPPIQQQQQEEGSGQMNLLVQAAVSFLRNSACCC